ncbi:MAG: hypothetical protein L6Q92_12665 [Phycisphaerae bacterium]|nr:hypothetical protein [Phycisphaerae bacterium]
MGRTSTHRLTAREQRAVCEHLPLVYLQLGRQRRMRGGEIDADLHDELIQEGCVALAAAVRAHERDRHGEFAPYALARIHEAMSRWLHEQVSSIRVPVSTQRRARARWRGGDRHDPRSAPRRVSGPPERLAGAAPRSACPRDSAALRERGAPTIGEAIGQRILRALRAVRARVARSSDPDAALQRRILDERLSIPEPEARRSLRELGRESSAPLARVVRREARLVAEVRRTLERDRALRYLRRLGRRRPDGWRETLSRGELRRLARAERRNQRRGRDG